MVLLVRQRDVLSVEDKLLQIYKAKAEETQVPQFSRHELRTTPSVVCAAFSIRKPENGTFQCKFNVTEETSDLCDADKELYLEMWNKDGTLETLIFEDQQCCNNSKSGVDELQKCLPNKSPSAFLP